MMIMAAIMNIFWWQQALLILIITLSVAYLAFSIAGDVIRGIKKLFNSSNGKKNYGGPDEEDEDFYKKQKARLLE